MKKTLIRIFCIITILVSTQPLFAQVSYETVVTSDGFMGMGAFKSTTKTFIVKNAQRTETDLKFTGKLMKYASPKGTEVSVVRLDKEVVWNINESKKTYQEMTFDEIKEMFKQVSEYESPEMPEQDQDYEAEYKWEKPSVKVKDLKKSKPINGYKCNNYLASITTIGTHIESGQKDTMLFVSDIWNTDDVTKNMDQVYAFNKKYMELIGIDIPENQGIAMITGMYQNQMQTLSKEVSKLKGHPIINDMKLTITTNAVPKQESEAEESISLRDIQKNFGGLLGKKIMKDAAKKKKKEKVGSAKVLFHMTTEEKNISSSDLSNTLFEIKKGYKLKK